MNTLKLISVREAAKEIGLTLQGTYLRLQAAGVDIIYEPFGPGTKGYIELKDLARIRKPVKSKGRPRKITKKRAA